jgi:2-desacetyl-2-hydroxyethyl bacteriochlorophyllide A dehydrogenase
LKTLILKEIGAFELTETPEPNKPTENEVLLKIHAIGICGTDYHAYNGRQPFFTYPRILGHELGAEIVALGESVKNLKVGEKVSVEPYLNCGQCDACQRGKGNCCENLSVIGVHEDGGMREFIKIPANKIHVSKVLDFEQLALVETLAIGCHAVNRADPQASETALVVGAGPIGLSTMQFLSIRKIPFGVLDLNENRLAFAQKTFQPKFLAKNIEELPKTIHYVFDATGNKKSMETAIDLVSHGGKVIFVGLIIDDISFFDPKFHRKEVTLFSSRNALPADFEYIIEKMETGEINTKAWISHKSTLEEFQTTIKEWLKPESLIVKGILNL